MSKDIEVGDVWVNKEGKKYYIFNIFEDKIIKGFSTSTGRMDSFCMNLYSFVSDYSYLGKSKVNIEDLFKTENE